jgi:hypothetical protein
MASQLNIGVQRQSYEPFEAVDSEAENPNADASLSGDSAGANTGDGVAPPIEGERVNPAPAETNTATNTFNRYGIGDTVILGRPEYMNYASVAAPENVVDPDEGSIAALPAASVIPVAMPTGFIPTPELRAEPTPVCPDQADLGSSGTEAPAPTATPTLDNPRTDASSYAKDAANAPAVQRGTKLPPRDSVVFTAASEYGAQHGFSAEEIDQVAVILAYYHCETPQHCTDTLSSLPFHITSIMQAIGWNSEGFYDVGFALLGMQDAQAIMNGDPNAGNRNLPDGRADRGVDMMGVQQVGGSGGARAGAGQGEQDYANEMSAASYSADNFYYGLGDDYSDESYDASNSNDAYDPANSSPQIDYDPLPSLPPVDSNGPIILPPPDVRVDNTPDPIPNVGAADSFAQAAGNSSVDNGLGNSLNGEIGTNGSANSDNGDPSQQSVGNATGNTNGAGGNSLPFDDDAANEEVTLTPEEEARLPRTSVEIGPLQAAPNLSTPPSPESQLNFMGLNGNGQPIYSDPASRQAAPSEIVPTNDRFHGFANAVEGSIRGYDTNGTPYSGVADASAPGGIRWYSLDFADTNAFRASQAADLLATGGGGGGGAVSTTESLPPVENLYTPFEGHAASNYRDAVAVMMNPNASMDERIINGTLATLSSPIAAIDMMGEGMMNAANAAARAGQWIAQADVTTNPDIRVTSTLRGIVEMTNAFNGAVGPFAGAVGVPQRVMTVEELARQNMQSAEAYRAARATYSGLGDNGGIYTSTRPLADVFPELVGVNPHYVPGAPPGTNVNCASCANAAQARLSGLDAEATALPSGRYAAPSDLFQSVPLGFQPPTTVAAIEQQMLAAGDGAYGLVLIGPEGATQHVINVVNRDGTVYFVDTQLGRIVTLPPNVEVRLGTPL